MVCYKRKPRKNIKRMIMMLKKMTSADAAVPMRRNSNIRKEKNEGVCSVCVGIKKWLGTKIVKRVHLEYVRSKGGSGIMYFVDKNGKIEPIFPMCSGL